MLSEERQGDITISLSLHISAADLESRAAGASANLEHTDKMVHRCTYLVKECCRLNMAECRAYRPPSRDDTLAVQLLLCNCKLGKPGVCFFVAHMAVINDHSQTLTIRQRHKKHSFLLPHGKDGRIRLLTALALTCPAARYKAGITRGVVLRLECVRRPSDNYE